MTKYIGCKVCLNGVQLTVASTVYADALELDVLNDRERPPATGARWTLKADGIYRCSHLGHAKHKQRTAVKIAPHPNYIGVPGLEERFLK